MVEQNPEQLNTIFHALADSTRRSLLRRLAKHEHSIGELAEPLDMSLAAASKHIKVLENAGLVERHITGRRHVCRLAASRLAEAHEWLRYYERFWNARLGMLEKMLDEE
jgi:DNA-binding transcriptional ArsR family regulator